jgi:two-component system, sensor histidine kinase LadS
MPKQLIKKTSLCFLWFMWLSIFGTNTVNAQQAVSLNGHENGVQLDEKFSLWFDDSGEKSLEDAIQALEQDVFKSPQSFGSTGLKKGAIWTHFTLQNPSNKTIVVNLEYIDHQVIALQAFSRLSNGQQTYESVADLGLDRPFSQREIVHNRFVFQAEIPAQQTSEFLVKFSSDGMGFVFPNLRLWSPNALQRAQTIETSAIAFLIGGFFLMSLLALAGGVATGERFFYVYSIYSLSKIAAWATILGYTHQFIVTDSFHWSYMSMSGAVSIFLGTLFARMFLKTNTYTPWLDYFLLVVMANAVFLFVCAVFKNTTFSVISMTVALLLYPFILVAGLRRWYQGSKEAGVFALAWSVLVGGLVVQALRDLGFVEHTFINYYWPPFASYTEMMVILVAMGLTVRRLRLFKETAEQRYTLQLENSKAELEALVKERTRELEIEKQHAELEAKTDALTGIRNRRSFFADSTELFARIESEELTFSLLMFDIDNFKSINDKFGHMVGDQALRAFSDTICSKIRESDIFGRLGGEEFSLLLCGSKQHALQMAERLREEISQLAIETPNGLLQFTTSIGVAHLNNETMIEELLNLADNALYAAKSQGRNTVIEST